MMNNMSGYHFFQTILHSALGKSVIIQNTRFKSGGCINNTLKLETSAGNFFLKWQSNIPEDMFEKEAAGLQLLRQAADLKVPEVLGFGAVEGKSYLIMEYIVSALPLGNYWRQFGAGLAAMHKNNSNTYYGLDHDNYIGKLPQSNKTKTSWIDFFTENRLEFQLKLAVQNKLVDSAFVNRYRNLYKKLSGLLPVDKPALLHGDLWSGNAMVSAEGKACIIDPAVYYGNREIELAFTKMFGGFDRDFYAAYEEVYPLEPGFNERADIYNIYPHMVHVNLFGTSYLNGVDHVLRRYA